MTRKHLIYGFRDPFDDKIKIMPSEIFKITLDENSDIQPVCTRAARPVAFAYRDKLETKLSSMVEGVISPVTEPSDWCAPIVVNRKKDSDDICMCVDLSKLNQYVKHEHFFQDHHRARL